MQKGEKGMATNDWLKGIIVGGLVGVALGILFAPKSGRETWEDISRTTNDLVDRTRQQCGEAKAKLEQMATGNWESYTDKKDRLMRAINAGVESFRQEASKESPS
jgi:gas vesicle protein